MYLCPELLLETQHTAPDYPVKTTPATEDDFVSEEPTQPDRGRTRPPLQSLYGPAGLLEADETSVKQSDQHVVELRWQEGHLKWSANMKHYFLNQHDKI